MRITRYEHNPILTPGLYDWRKCVTFNPGVVYDGKRFLLYERAAGTLRPYQCYIGGWESEDGKHFRPLSDKPVFTPEMLGMPKGSVQDARCVMLDGKIYMTYAFQPYQFDCYPTGTGLPDYPCDKYPEWKEEGIPEMLTQSGLAVSEDGVHFEQLAWVTPKEIDDRDVCLFPEKVNGRYALLRRPIDYVGPAYGTELPGIWLSYSDDLIHWDDPVLVATAENPEWEGIKIGAAASPVKTDKGWLLLYHGVDLGSCYRVGAMLLDLDDPSKVIARSKRFVMEPEEYYEKAGLVIPNVVFPTAAIVRDGLLYIYYGCCDTCISLATVPVDELLAELEPRG